MIVAPNITNMVGVFTMGFGIMTSVVTNNVSALAALANGLLPLRKVERSDSRRSETVPAEPIVEDRGRRNRSLSCMRLYSPIICQPLQNSFASKKIGWVANGLWLVKGTSTPARKDHPSWISTR